MSELEATTKFNDLASKFCQLVVHTEEDKRHMHKILHEFNQLNYQYPIATNATKTLLLVHQCCTLIPPDDLELVTKCCRLFTNLIDRQHVTIGGKTLILAIRWCLQVLKQTDPDYCGEILTVLNALLQDNLHHANTLLLTIVYEDSPILILAMNNLHPEMLMSVIHCLEICTTLPNNVRSKTNPRVVSQLELCGKIFMKYLVEFKVDKFEDITWDKILASCFQGLHNIILQDSEFVGKNLELLLGICRSYMAYGLGSVQFVTPQKLVPNVLTISEVPISIPSEKKGGKIVKQHKQRTPSTKVDVKQRKKEYVSKTNALGVNKRPTTSSSNFSNIENKTAPGLYAAQSKVRQTALNTLLEIVKLTDKHTIFRYWLSFIPDDSLSSISKDKYLVTCLILDKTEEVRLAALNVLLTLLTRSKLYLAQAEYNEKVQTYTSFSMILGSTLFHLHTILSTCIFKEFSNPVIVQILKCFAALIQATPYHKLPTGLITNIVKDATTYMTSQDTAVQVACFTVLRCLLALEPQLEETEVALTFQLEYSGLHGINFVNPLSDIFGDSSEEINIIERIAKLDPPWLLERCLNNLGTCLDGRTSQVGSDVIANPVKLESLQILSAMTKNYFKYLLLSYRSHLIKTLSNCLVDRNTDLQLYAGRTIDFIGQAINQQVSRTDDGKFLKIEQGLVFWHMLLDTIIQSLIRSVEHSVLRTVGCDCLGSIGLKMFEHLPRNKQLLIITSLFSCSSDEEYNVRAAAVRALGISVMYPRLRKDLGFVADVANVILKMLEENNLGVRIKASWSLGNISDALVLNKQNRRIEDVSDDIVLILLRISIKVSCDNDKIKVNAVRALGNILQLVSVNFEEITDEGIEVLVTNATTGTNMKIRWNACYAIGGVLKNSELLLNSDSRRNKLFSALLNLVCNFPNFKVRINAALALSCPKNREVYGKYFTTIWDSLLKALENTQNIEDFKEYNHRDQLIDQICLTLGYLMTRLKKNDLPILQDILISHLDFFKLQMHKAMERVVSEKSTIFTSAVAHIRVLTADKTLSNREKETMSMLTTVFNQE